MGLSFLPLSKNSAGTPSASATAARFSSPIFPFDMSRITPMPERAWAVAIDCDGRELVRVEAHIDGGAISAVLPAFPPGTKGVVLIHEEGDEEWPQELEPHDFEELPTESLGHVWQVG